MSEVEALADKYLPMPETVTVGPEHSRPMANDNRMPGPPVSLDMGAIMDGMFPPGTLGRAMRVDLEALQRKLREIAEGSLKLIEERNALLAEVVAARGLLAENGMAITYEHDVGALDAARARYLFARAKVRIAAPTPVADDRPNAAEPNEPKINRLNTGPISHEEALRIALAYIARAFGRPADRLRHSIPADPRHDTDIRLTEYIRQQQEREAELQKLRAENNRLSHIELFNPQGLAVEVENGRASLWRSDSVGLKALTREELWGWLRRFEAVERECEAWRQWDRLRTDERDSLPSVPSMSPSAELRMAAANLVAARIHRDRITNPSAEATT